MNLVASIVIVIAVAGAVACSADSGASNEDASNDTEQSGDQQSGDQQTDGATGNATEENTDTDTELNASPDATVTSDGDGPAPATSVGELDLSGTNSEATSIETAAPADSEGTPSQTESAATAPSDSHSGSEPDATDGSAGGTNEPPVVGSSEQEPAPSDGMVLTAEEFCSRRAHLDDAWCEYRDRCCTVEDIESGVFALPGCMAQDLTEQVCNEEIVEALTDGLTFDGAWAGDCLGELAPFEYAVPDSCAGTWGDEAYVQQHNVPEMWELASCQRMLTANVQEGEPCNNVRACAPGLGCGPSSSPDGETFLCHARGGVGSPCYSANECETSLTCFPFDNGSCRALSPTNGPCDKIDDCEEGNMCHLDYCAPILVEGQSCPNYTFCLNELSCDFSTAICTAVLSDGEGPCDSNFDCEGRCDMTTSTCTSICGGTR
jgi:hypothetical protein